MCQDAKLSNTTFWIYWTGASTKPGWTLKHTSQWLPSESQVVAAILTIALFILVYSTHLKESQKLEYMFLRNLLVLSTLVLLFEPTKETEIPGMMIKPCQLIRWLWCNLPLLENQLKNDVMKQQWSRGAFNLLTTDRNTCSSPRWQCANSTKTFSVGR